jgi:CRISPR system Cascade subunit CasE
MFLSCLLIDTGCNPDRPRPGRLWLHNLYRVHQRLCMGFPSAVRVHEDDLFLRPFSPEDFGQGHVHLPRADRQGFLFRVDPRPPGRAVILVQSAIKPNWSYAFQNAQHLLAAAPAVRPWEPSFTDGQSLRFRLRANTVRRIAPSEPGKDGPRVPVAATAEGLRGWLDRRAERSGFALGELASVVPGYIYWNKSAKRGEGLRLRSVVYEGLLTVRDAGAFRRTVEAGIGPAKAFGFGLLSLAPA